MKGEKLWSCEKEMAKELLHSFIDGMDNLGFSEEEILHNPSFFITREEERRANDRVIKNRKLMEEIRIESSDP